MYCSGCGQPLVPNQSMCAHCGARTAATMTPGYPPSGYLPCARVERHLQTLAILWLAYSLFAILAWFIAVPFLGVMLGHHPHFFGDPSEVPFFMSMHWLLPLVTVFVYGRAALGLLVGIGLLRRERWARPLAIIVGILTLFKPPVGTALAIYTLWVLLPAQSAVEYDAVAIR